MDRERFNQQPCTRYWYQQQILQLLTFFLFTSSGFFPGCCVWCSTHPLPNAPQLELPSVPSPSFITLLYNTALTLV